MSTTTESQSQKKSMKKNKSSKEGVVEVTELVTEEVTETKPKKTQKKTTKKNESKTTNPELAVEVPELVTEVIDMPETMPETMPESMPETISFTMNGLEEVCKGDASQMELFFKNFAELTTVAKSLKAHIKTIKDAARAVVKAEKEELQRLKFIEVVNKITAKEGYEGATADEVLTSHPDYDSLKQWVTDFKQNIKDTKQAEKDAKQAEKDTKQAEKDAKQAEKTEKEAELREKLNGKVTEFQDALDYCPQYDPTTIELKDLKSLHTRCKQLTQLKKMREQVMGVPEYEEESITDDELKVMYGRVKLLQQYNKVDDETQGVLAMSLDYGCDKDDATIKDVIATIKAALVDEKANGVLIGHDEE
jgi:hypothetical protein